MGTLVIDHTHACNVCTVPDVSDSTMCSMMLERYDDENGACCHEKLPDRNVSELPDEST